MHTQKWLTNAGLRRHGTRHVFYRKYLIVFALAAGLICLEACRKIEISSVRIEDTALERRFFETDANADSGLLTFVNNVREQNKAFDFVPYFIANNGLPQWNKSIMMRSGGAAVIVVPLVLEGRSEVHAVMTGKRDATGRFRFAVYRKDLLAMYGIGTATKPGLGAADVQLLINHFNRLLFGLEQYHLSDIRLLPEAVRAAHPALMEVKKLRGKIRSGSNSRIGRDTATEYGCKTFTEETEWWYNPNGDACNCDGDEYYAFSTYTSVTVCVESEIGDDDDKPIIKWWEAGGGGGGGGPLPADTLNVDSVAIHVSDLFNQVKETADSLKYISDTSRSEYFFAVAKRAGNIIPVNIRTDGKENQVKPDLRMAPGDELLGDWHSHPNDEMGFSNSDIALVLRLLNFKGATAFLTSNKNVYALVVVDPVKAKNFFAAFNTRDQNLKVDELYDAGYQFVTGGGGTENTRMKMTERAIKKVVGDFAETGILCLKAERKLVNIFSKLN